MLPYIWRRAKRRFSRGAHRVNIQTVTSRALLSRKRAGHIRPCRNYIRVFEHRVGEISAVSIPDDINAGPKVMK